jgi:hypothetical protein
MFRMKREEFLEMPNWWQHLKRKKVFNLPTV